MARIFAMAHVAPVLAALVMAACGGTAVVDDEPTGEGGSGSGLAGPSSGPGSAPGAGGSPVTSSSGTPGTGGSSLQAACAAACSSVSACAAPDCFDSCASSNPGCASAFEPFLDCIAGFVDPDACALPTQCQPALDNWLVCQGWCVAGAGWSGSGDGSGACTSLLEACGPVGAYEVSCEPIGGGMLQCRCSEDGVTAGQCLEQSDGLTCDPQLGCCTTVFFVPG